MNRKRKAKSAAVVLVRRYAPPEVRIPRRLGGGVLKEYAELELGSGRLLKYCLAYINPAIFAGDKGRVLGYDNAHGFPHRHFMGDVTLEPELPWETILKRFEREWQEIALAQCGGKS